MKSVSQTEPMSAWDRAMTAAVVLAVATESTGGIRLRAHAGPVRDAWLNGFRALLAIDAPVRRMPATIGDGRLLGGLDLAATLQTGQPVAERGLLAEADGGILIVAMAERVSLGTAAKLAAVMDRREVATERDGLALASPARFGVVALDEGLEEDEHLALALTERLAMSVDLRTISHRDLTPFPYDQAAIVDAKCRLAAISASDEIVVALCGTAAALGIGSVRAPLQALQVARILAALAEHSAVEDDDAALAAMLVLAPRATQLPASADEPEEPEPQEQVQEEQKQEERNQEEQQEPEQQEQQEPEASQQNDLQNQPEDQDQPSQPQQPPDDVVLEAALAAIPAGLLAQLKASAAQTGSRAAGRAGNYQHAATRGRVVGVKSGDLRSGAKLDVVETLRAAAPWQMLRKRQMAQNLALQASTAVAVRREDFRVARYKHRTQTTTIFVVDASGSSALQRLAEAKGAVRLLLAECYIRRDEVALITFRGKGADLVLPPTRALVRAQRALAAVPGGGGTPIATAIDAAAELADTVKRNGRTPAIVFMTDGRANIGRDGAGGRPKAQEEARAAAKILRSRHGSTILIDTSPQPQPLAAELAAIMGACYVPLPHADAQRVAQAVSLMRGNAHANSPARNAA